MSIGKSHLAEWGKGRSQLVNFSGGTMVAFVDLLFFLLQKLNSPASPSAAACDLFVFPGVDIWVGYYHDTGQLLEDFCQTMLAGMGIEEKKRNKLQGVIFLLLYMPRLRAEMPKAVGNLHPADFAESCRFSDETFIPFIQRLMGGGSSRDANEEEPAGGLPAFLCQPSVRFLFRVFLPCATYFHTTPGNLLANAVSGNETALERLLTIDKHALFLPEIAAIHHARAAMDFTRYRTTIAKYLGKSLPVMTRRKLKQGLGALQHIQFSRMDKQIKNNPDIPSELLSKARELNRLTIADIQDQFTAHERDLGRISPPQTDPEVEDFSAFRQAILRTSRELSVFMDESVK